MLHVSRVAAAALFVSCATSAPPAAPPAPVGAAPDTAAAPPVALDPAPLAPGAAVHLRPQQARFLAHQRVEIQNDFQGLPPRQQLGFRSWFAVTVLDSTDAAGRLAAVFHVDSIVADSGTLLPPVMNLAAARGLSVRGWVAPSGELQDAAYSDSVVAQNLGRLLGWFRRFFPHLPPEGVHPGAAWSDTVRSSEPGGGANIERTAVVQTRAGVWEAYAGADALRLDVAETYEFSGNGESGGQPLELTGRGSRVGTDYLSGDGRYLGGSSADTATMTIVLPMQGYSIPQRQIAQLTLTRLPW